MSNQIGIIGYDVAGSPMSIEECGENDDPGLDVVTQENPNKFVYQSKKLSDHEFSTYLISDTPFSPAQILEVERQIDKT